MLDPSLCPRSEHYQPSPRAVVFRDSRGVHRLEEGAIAMTTLWRLSQSCPNPDPDYIAAHLSNFGLKDDPIYNVAWAMHQARSQRDVVVIRKYSGLTHPERPFAVAATVIMLEGEDVRQVLALGIRLGHDWKKCEDLSVPMSFPPYLSDIDRHLQHAHCRLAAGAPGAEEAVVSATCSLAAELLHDQAELLEVSEEDFRRHLANVDAIVQKALEALRHMQQARQKSELVVGGIIDVLIQEAWFDIKIRHEWRVRDAQVKKWAFERKKATKNKSRRAKQANLAETATALDLDSIIHELHQRTANYRRTASGVHSLVDAGLARLISHPEARIAHSVDALAQGSEPASDILVELVPPQKIKASNVFDTSAADRGVLRPARQPNNFLSQLEESAIRDREFVMAYRREQTRKLLLQEEAEIKCATCLSLQEFSNSHCVELASSSPRSTMGNASCVSSTRSIITAISVASAPGGFNHKRCLLPCTRFLRSNCPAQADETCSTGQTVSAGRLRALGGDELLGPDGKVAKTIRATRLPAQDRDIVRLQFSNGSFSVTADHHVFVEAEGTEGFDAVPAGEVLGRAYRLPRILTGAGLQPLIKVDFSTQKTELIEVVFADDAAVLAWVPPSRCRGRGGHGARSRTLSPRTAVVCRGSLPTAEDLVCERGMVVQKGFLDERPRHVWKRYHSVGDLPRMPLWFSAGSLRHRQNFPELCRICVEHQRSLADPNAPPCKHGTKCYRCHMPH